MTEHRLPDGFTIRLHDDVGLGTSFSRDARVLTADPRVREALDGRGLVVRDDLTAAIAARLLDLDLAVPVLDGNAEDRSGPFTLDDVTVVVPVLDDAARVDRLLDGLTGSVVCVVVDDASRDPEAIAKVAARHGAQLVRLDRNVGPAAARNHGLRHVATPLVAFVDADVAVAPDDLGALLPHFTDPALAVVAPRVRAAAGQRWFQRYERAEGGLDLGPVPATVRGWSAVAYVPSACAVARVDRLGRGFDEGLRSGEDVDLVWRLLADGHRVRYEPAVVVEHAQRATAWGWAGRQFFYGTSAAPLARRHGEQVAPAVLTPAQAALLASLVLLRGRGRALGVVPAVLVARRAWRTVPDELFPVRARLAAAVLTMTARQGVGLVVHHASPVSLGAAVLSRRARRTLLVLGTGEAVVAWARSDRSLDPVTFAAARRVSTGAYGLGVWWGAARAGSWRAVLPHVVRQRRR